MAVVRGRTRALAPKARASACAHAPVDALIALDRLDIEPTIIDEGAISVSARSGVCRSSRCAESVSLRARTTRRAAPSSHARFEGLTPPQAFSKYS